MPSSLRIIEGDYLRDILDQPTALEDTLSGLEQTPSLRALARSLNRGAFRRVVLTGMGSSLHALHPLNLELVDHGLTPVMAETSELIHYQTRLFDARSLIIAVSQSGRSAEIVSMLKVNRRRSPLIAVTNTPDSPLARLADTTILTLAGGEFSVSCKTYVAALLALKWLADVLREKQLARTRRELAAAASMASAYLTGWRNRVHILADRLRNSRQLYLVGRGASLAAACTGGLIIKESDHFPAEGMSCAAFRHGPLENVKEETFVLVFGGSSKTRALNRRLLGDIRKRRGQAELAGDGASLAALRLPDVPDSIRPVLEILPVEMITLALAALAGREAGRFESASKVTTTE